jgi:hypothetical protein
MLHILKVLGGGGERLLVVETQKRWCVKFGSGGGRMELECTGVEVLARACKALKGVKSGDSRGRN